MSDRSTEGRAPAESGIYPHLRERYVGPGMNGSLAYREIVCTQCGREWSAGVRERAGTTAQMRKDAQEHVCPPAASPSPAGGEPKHVCGVEGFDQMRGDRCEACSAAVVADSGDFATEDTLEATERHRVPPAEPERPDLDEPVWPATEPDPEAEAQANELESWYEDFKRERDAESAAVPPTRLDIGVEGTAFDDAIKELVNAGLAVETSDSDSPASTVIVESLRLDCDAALVRDISRAAKRAVEAELPEDEPDYTSPWVYERIIMTALSVASGRADATLADLRARAEKLDRCLAFFASVIKSGESWSQTCEQELHAARASGSPGRTDTNREKGDE